MIKLVAFIPRRPDITLERFHVHWRAPHGEMAKGVTLFKRYVQGHRVASVDPGLGPTRFEGVAEIWFDSLEAALQQPDEPTYAALVGPDEANFIDRDALAYLYLREDVVVAGPPVAADDGGVKVVQGVRRAPGLSPDEFDARWSAEDPGLAQALGAIRHTRDVTLPYHHDNGTALYDGVRELRWVDLAAYERSRAEAPDAWARLLDRSVVDPGSSSSMLVEEFRLIWP